MPAPQPAPDRVVKTISHYAILGKIREGGMGAVYTDREGDKHREG